MSWLVFAVLVCASVAHVSSRGNFRGREDVDYGLEFENGTTLPPITTTPGDWPTTTIPNPTPNRTYDLVAVRQYKVEYLLCMGSAISRKHILTTARCLYDQDSTTVFVTPTLPLSKEIYEVRNITTHPSFEVNPKDADIGVITLKYALIEGDALIFSLPPSYQKLPMYQEALIYGNTFSANRETFYVQLIYGKLFSTAKCALILREFIDCETFCAGSLDQKIVKGSFDLGVPLAISKNLTEKTLVGVYTQMGSNVPIRVAKYDSIVPYLDWIKDIIKANNLNLIHTKNL